MPAPLLQQERALKSPLLLGAAKLAETEARRVLRRVTAPSSHKEAKLAARPLSRRLAKVTHAVPLHIAEQLIRQVSCCGVGILAFQLQPNQPLWLDNRR